jgi:hypothetical protein
MLHMLGLVESFTDYLQSTQEMENETKFETPKKGKTKSKIYNSPLQLSSLPQQQSARTLKENLKHPK